MKNSLTSLALSLLLLATAATAWAAPKQEPTGVGLLGAPAIVNEVNVRAGTVTLWVHSTSHAHTFTVSAVCLYDPGIGSLAGLKPHMHVLVWTQAGPAGTLPVIYRLAQEAR